MENDWLVLNILNPNYDPGDFHTLGVDTTNTLFLSKEDYKKRKFVLDNFKDENGNFDDKKFDEYYSHLAYGFSVLDGSEHLMEYDPFDSLRKFPGKQERDSFNIYRVSNPTGQKIGAAGINLVSESPYSQREWAEKLKVVDSATGEELDYSPNDHALFVNPKEWFLDLFRDPLVLAIYDEDGEHEDPISKQIVQHKKGEVKLNKEGKPYWETLNGRSFHGRLMLSSSDVYTVDGTTMNAYDCFDSDDIEKSIAGVVAKTAWSIVPLFTPISPIYAGVIAAREITKALPMLDGIFGAITGNNEDTAFTKFSNTLSGKMTLWTGSQSDYANEHTISIEGLANLLSDVALLWSQLKLIAQSLAKLRGIGSLEAILAKATQQAEKTFAKESSRITKLIKEEELRALGLAATDAEKAAISAEFAERAKTFVGTPETWKNTVLGQSLIAKSSEQLIKSADKLYKIGANTSLAHMAIVSNTDVYGSMLEHGATKREAAIVSLASTLGMFAVDKWLGLDKIFIDNISTENRILLRKAFTEEAKLMQPEFTNIFKNPNLSKAEKVQQLFAKGKELGKKATNTFFSDIKDHTASGLKKAIAEGIEEVNEELVTDLSKQFYQLAGELGADTSVNNVEAFDNWDLKKLLSRYGMNFLGGFLGGGLFYGVEQFNARPSVKDSDHSSIIYASRNMKTQDMLKYLEKMWKLGRLGSTTLSATPMTNEDGSIYLDESGKRVYNTAKKGEDTVNDFIYKRLREEIMQIDGIIRLYGDDLSEDDLFKLETYNEPRFQALEDYLKGAAYTTKYFELYQDILTKFVDTEVKLRNLKAPDLKTSPEYAKYEEEYNRLNLLKTIYRQQLDDFKSGRASINFLRMMLMHLDPRINSKYTKSSFEHWLSAEKGIKNIDSLNNEEYSYYKKEYLENIKPFQKNDLQQKYQEFLHLEKTILPELMQIQEQMKDFKKWHEEIQKLFTTKGPFALRNEFNYDSLLPGEDETSDSYINRNILLEDESPEEFAARKNLRIQQINELQKLEDSRIINEALNILRNAGFIDSATKRRLLSMIRSNKKQIITDKTSAIRSKWKDYGDIILNDDFSNVNDILKQIEREIRKEIYHNSESRASERRKVLSKVPDLVERVKTIAGGDNIMLYLDALTILANDGVITQREFVDLSSALNEDTSGDLETALNTLHIGVSGTYKVSDTDYDPDFGESPIYTGQIKAIEDLIDRVKLTVKNDIDFAISEIKDNPYYNFLEQVSNIKEAPNPIIEIVKKLSLGLNRDYRNTELLLQTLYERASSGENSEFRLTEAEQSAIDESMDLLERALGYIYAAKRQSDAVNPFQHNIVVNEIAKKHKVENWEELPVLDEDVSDLYQKEIIDYMREIGVWENDDWNVGSWKYWDSNSTKNRINKFFNASKNYTKIKIEWLEANKDKFKGDDFDLFEGADIIPNTGDEIYLHKLENLFYNNVQKALEKYTDFGEILAKTKFQEILNPVDLTEQNTTELNEKMSIDLFTAMDKAMYILSIAALSSSDFNRVYKEIIDNGNIAPLITLKVADRTACALIHDLRNGNKIWKSGIQKYHLWSGAKSLLFSNLVSLFGDGGAGKTVGCIKVIREFIGGNKEDVWIVAPGENQLSNLRDLNTEVFTIDELKEKLISKYTTEELEVEGGFTTNFVNSVSTELKTFPKAIIIDEATHLDSTTLQAIHKIADENNVAIIGVGDDIQNGYEQFSGESNVVSNIGDANVVFCGRTSRLGITLRDANLLKSENNFRISRIINSLLRIPVKESIVERERKLKEQLEALNDLSLLYFFGDTINGDFITRSITQDILDAIPESINDIAFVGTSDSNAYRMLKSKFGDKLELLDSPTKIQGKEFDFVIVDQEWNLDKSGSTESRAYNAVKFLKNLYTMATRSRLATIYIDNGLSNIVKNLKTEHKGIIKTFTPKIIDDFKKLEIAVIESFKIEEKKAIIPEQNGLTLIDKINDLIDRMNSTTDLKKWKELEQELYILKELLEDKATELNELKPAPDEKSDENDISEPEPEKVPILDNIITEQSDNPILLIQPVTSELNYLAYGSVHYAGIPISKSITERGYDYDFSTNTRGFNGKCDLLVVLDEDESLSYNSFKDAAKIKDFVNRLLSLKSDIIFNSEYNSRLKAYMTKEEYENMKFYIVAIKAEDFNDSFVGMSDLNKDDEKFSPDKSKQKYVFKIVARFEHDGILNEISLGNLSNPDTTENNTQLIIQNATERLSKHPEEKEYLIKFIESVRNGDYIKNYRNFLNDLVLNKELEISKENLNFTNTRASLIKLPKKKTLIKFKVDNPHLVVSPTYFFRPTLDIGNSDIRTLLAQRAVVFISPNTTLSPNKLAEIWVDELTNGKPHSVLMIKLLNRGVTFLDLLNKENKRSNRFAVSTRNGMSWFPFETKIMSYRMLASLWNYRADLIDFINQVKNRINESGEFDSLEELDRAIKDYAISMKSKLDSGMSIEDAESDTLSEDERFRKIEAINKSIQNPRFRLGSRSDADTIIRKIDTDFYGIFTTFENANKMFSSIDSLLELLKSFIEIKKDGIIVDKSLRIGNKKGRLTEQITSIYDTAEGVFGGQIFKFSSANDSGNDIRFIPLLLLKLYGRSGVYAKDSQTFNEGSFIFDFKVNNLEQAFNLKDLITKGKETLDLLNLCLFGTTEELTLNTERASEAYFKNGLYIDPMCTVNGESAATYSGGSFVEVGNSDYSFFIEYGIRFPRINFNPNNINLDRNNNQGPTVPETPIVEKIILLSRDSVKSKIFKSYLTKNSEKTIGQQFKELFGLSMSDDEFNKYYNKSIKLDWFELNLCYILDNGTVIGAIDLDKGLIISALSENLDSPELVEQNRQNIIAYYNTSSTQYEDIYDVIGSAEQDDFITQYMKNNNCW